jgi:hypothetical protein
MIKFFKSYALSIIAVLTLLAPALVPLAASAATSCGGTASSVEKGVLYSTTGSSSSSTSLCSSTGVDNGSIGNLAHTIVNLFSIVVGAASIIMIIYGGFRYITSGGDSTRVGNAKSTLVYAVIGLVVVALAQVIVHFVLSQSSNIASSTS